MPAARRTRSWCPLVIGSKVPGYTASRFMPASRGGRGRRVSVQMIPDLAGALGPDKFEARRQRREALAGGALDIDPRPRRQPAPRGERRGAGRQEAGRVGRVQEHHLVLTRGTGKKTERIGPCQLRSHGLPFLEARPQLADGRGIAVHEGHRSRPARERFQAQRTAAGEQVEAARAGQLRREPVEQGLAHAVRRRPDVCIRREAQLPAAPAAADDAQYARRRATAAARTLGSLDPGRHALECPPPPLRSPRSAPCHCSCPERTLKAASSINEALTRQHRQEGTRPVSRGTRTLTAARIELLVRKNKQYRGRACLPSCVATVGSYRDMKTLVVAATAAVGLLLGACSGGGYGTVGSTDTSSGNGNPGGSTPV